MVFGQSSKKSAFEGRNLSYINHYHSFSLAFDSYESGLLEETMKDGIKVVTFFVSIAILFQGCSAP